MALLTKRHDVAFAPANENSNAAAKPITGFKSQGRNRAAAAEVLKQPKFSIERRHYKNSAALLNMRLLQLQNIPFRIAYIDDKQWLIRPTKIGYFTKRLSTCINDF